jgi:catechol 2,3-dioxygenase-like lactoylglutathione lyase family enzyme
VVFRAVPILPSDDLNVALAFYERLGFENLGAPPEEWDYLFLGVNGVELHFIGLSAGRRPAGSCFIWVDDANGIYDEWQAQMESPARLEPPVDTEYGMRTFTMYDPYGNEIRVGSPLEPERFGSLLP